MNTVERSRIAGQPRAQYSQDSWEFATSRQVVKRKAQTSIGSKLLNAKSESFLETSQMMEPPQELVELEPPQDDNLDSTDEANQNSQPIFDLIKNADNTSYEAGVEAQLHLIHTRKEVIKHASQSAWASTCATLILFNNDGGSQYQHLSELVGCGKMSESGQRNEVHIDECTGLTSLFAVAAEAYIASNGLRIQVKKDDISTKNGYIVSKWMGKPTDEELFGIWISSSEIRLSSTVIVLLIKPEKISSVYNELKSITPQAILFLRRITRLRIRYNNESEGSFNFEEVTIRRLESSRVEHVDEEAVGFTAKLSEVKELGRKTESRHYFIWEQNFKLISWKDADVKTSPAITLKFAFPQRLQTESDFQREEYAPLASLLVSGFPFLISCDHLSQLPCGTFRLECPMAWVQEVVASTSQAYCKAFSVLQTKSYAEPASPTFVSPVNMYKYIPVEACEGALEDVRKKILDNLKNQECVLVATNILSNIGRYLCTPCMTRRVCPSFRKILEKAYEEGEISVTVSRASWFIVHGSIETLYPRVLDELQVPWMSSSEYVNVLQDSTWLSRISDELYLQLAAFVSTFLYVRTSSVSVTQVDSLRIVKCQDEKGIKFVSLKDIRSSNMVMYIPPPWQSDYFRYWITKFNPWIRYRIIPQQTARAMETAGPQHEGVEWLTDAAIVCKINVQGFATRLLERCSGYERPIWHYDVCADFVLDVWNFVFTSVQRGEMERPRVLEWIAVVDENEHVLWVRSTPSMLLLPRSCSKWSLLEKDVDNAGSENDRAIVLSEKYLSWTPDSQACRYFLHKVFAATDLPDTTLPKIPLPKLKNLSPEESRLFFQWLNPWVESSSEEVDKFWQELRRTAWLRTKKHGLQCPKLCYMFEDENLFGECFVVDKCFYGDLYPYQSTLSKLGVRLNTEEKPEMVRKCRKRQSLVESVEVLRKSLRSV